ncbi:12947_t:CDS:2 [Acaulospora colombiana]|uniref:12947_t:CDS:1 n=1 Tax=Acaulospora colombiana TaxID=27376 RepID=A0ACA9LUS8_9GLOM|nr:12947_t:CDS:2 [Acaulospora colombiana]
MASPVSPPTLGFVQQSSTSIDEKEDKRSGQNEERPLHSSKARFWVNVIIISAYTVAVILAIVHHVFLANLHQRDAAHYSTDTRAWFGRASNFLSKIIATCLGAVAATALIQGIWNVITSDYTPVAVVDDLFSLPSPVALVSLLYKYPKLRLFPLIGITILIQALVLVSVLAPGALLTDASRVDRNITIPKLDLTSLPMYDDVMWWQETVRYYMMNDPVARWDVPADCGASCRFQITYSAPGISCRKMSGEETGLNPFDQQLFEEGVPWCAYFSATDQELIWGTNTMPLNISYVPMVAQLSNKQLVYVNQTSSSQGQLCQWQDKTFRADFTFKNNRKTVDVKTISNTNDVAQRCPWTSGGSLSRECSQYMGAALDLGYAYTMGFSGALGWTKNETLDYWEQAIVSQFVDYKYDTEAQTISLTPFSNASQGVEHNFAKAVLGTLLWFNQTNSAVIAVEVGSAWIYKPLMLWAIYGSALLLSLIAGLYGLHLARLGEIVREKKFSSFLIATRTRDLDAVCAQHSDVVMSTKLRHDASTGHFHVLNEEQDEKTEANPVALDEATTHTWTRSIIIVSFLLAIIFALVHHFFLHAMRNHNADAYPQYWIKGASNAFSQAVSICLGTAAAYSLTQASWRALKLHGGSVETIDNFFGLPSPLSVASLFKNVRKIQITYLIMIAVVIQALGLVTTFAPSALTVGSFPPRSAQLSAPALDLSTEYYAASQRYLGIWNNLIARLEENPPEAYWSVPSGRMVPTPLMDSGDFMISILRSYFKKRSGPKTTLHSDGTYEADFKYANNTVTLNTNLLSYSNSFTSNCTEADSGVASDRCQTYKDNAFAICQNFTIPLQGFKEIHLETGAPPGNLYNSVVYQRLFNVSFNFSGDGSVYFQPKFTNLSETLPALFSNVTTSLIPELGGTTSLSVEVEDNTRIWEYDPKALFAAYAPALAAVLLVGAYGLYCIHANGRAMDSKFSTLLLTTRSGALDGVYDTADNFDALLEKKLVYAKRGCFVPENREPSQDLGKEP